MCLNISDLGHLYLYKNIHENASICRTLWLYGCCCWLGPWALKSFTSKEPKECSTLQLERYTIIHLSILGFLEKYWLETCRHTIKVNMYKYQNHIAYLDHWVPISGPSFLESSAHSGPQHSGVDRAKGNPTEFT